MNRDRSQRNGRGQEGEHEDPARRMLESLSYQERQRAMRRLNAEIEANPENPTSLTVRGLLYQVLGDDRRASEDYGRVIQLEPGNTEAHDLRGHARA